MDAVILNQQLQALYESYLTSLYNQDWPDTVSAPLLMNVFDEYTQMPTKVLFVGQETHGWSRMDQHHTVEALQHMYASFGLGKYADYGDGKKPRYLRSPFWNFCRSCFHRLNSNDDVTKKTNGFLWTNISKFDSNSTTPHSDLQQRNRAGFALLKREIAIVQPNMIIFLIGMKYDGCLGDLFELNSEPILEGGLLRKLYDPVGLLPRLTFQTQHPKTLCMQKTYHTVLNKLIDIAISRSV